ncbi:MAG TPA: GyrI-like domain-containing protein [Caldimonas sp.]|nr:GyrI-like domain-containing protein [Caldimonas sp.]
MTTSTATTGAATAPRDSRGEYERRIHRVVAHIDSHLDEPLDLETLAAVANFSAFHFHRLFRAWTGETLGDYLRRRRVETGALRLLTQPRSTVLEVALAVGFGSGEAFARAFKTRFGATPSAWREERNPGQAERSLHQAMKSVDFDHGHSPTPLIEDTTMTTPTVSLIDMPPTPVAYYRHTGPYGTPVLSFWMERVAPWMAENNLFGRVRYGIVHDDPTIAEPAKCRYDACVVADAKEVLSGQPMRTPLPGGRYACSRFEGTVDEIDAAWQRMLSGWLPTSGLQLDARPLLEHYPIEAKFDPATGVFDCDICLPVKPL